MIGVLTVTVGALGTPTQAQAPAEKPTIDWNKGYQLTPLEHKRLRGKGLRDADVYTAANVARLTGMDVDVIAQKIRLGSRDYMLAQDYYLDPKLVRERRPEWGTPEWLAAVERGDPTWPPPKAKMAAP
jgi:hypothetical protein